MAGIPIHDEQGTYDRPHDLTCAYKPETVDRILAELGSRPWLERRPALAVVLFVERGAGRTVLAADTPAEIDMRESFGAAADAMAMQVRFPLASDLDLLGWEAHEQAARAGEAPALQWPASAGAVPLVGRLAWSDADLGWVADWTLPHDGRPHSWQVRGVNFDEAFRVAVRGSAQVLSGNGTPDRRPRGSRALQ